MYPGPTSNSALRKLAEDDVRRLARGDLPATADVVDALHQLGGGRCCVRGTRDVFGMDELEPVVPALGQVKRCSVNGSAKHLGQD